MLLAEGKLALVGSAYHPTGDLAELAVPETLTALIASRLDGLSPDERALVSDAAVLGQSFTTGGPLGGLGHRRRRSRAQAARSRPARAADPGRRPEQPRARPVRLRPGADPRGRLQHPRPARSQDAPPGGGALLRRAWAPTSSPERWPVTTSRRTPTRPKAPRPMPWPPRPGSRCAAPLSGRRPSVPTSRPLPRCARHCR